jgi:hypothetical protein
MHARPRQPEVHTEVYIYISTQSATACYGLPRPATACYGLPRPQQTRELACDEQFEHGKYWLSLHGDGHAHVAYVPAPYSSWSLAHDGDAFDYDRALTSLDQLCLSAATEAVRAGECSSCTIRVLAGGGDANWVVHQTTVSSTGE